MTSFFGVTHMWLIHAYIFFQKIIQNYFVILFKTVWPECVCKICQFLSLNIKSINLMQNYFHIIQSEVCIFKIFVMIFLLPLTFLICFGMCSTLQLPKYVTLLPFTYKAIQWVPNNFYWQCGSFTKPWVTMNFYII